MFYVYNKGYTTAQKAVMIEEATYKSWRRISFPKLNLAKKDLGRLAAKVKANCIQRSIRNLSKSLWYGL